MTIREIIQNDIVEDIIVYKKIYDSFIEFLKEDIDLEYEPKFSFDEFCIKMINNFEGVDDDFSKFLDQRSEHPLTERLMNSLMSIAFEEFKEDKKSIKKLQQIFYSTV
jgi:hypothetical protein